MSPSCTTEKVRTKQTQNPKVDPRVAASHAFYFAKIEIEVRTHERVFDDPPVRSPQLTRQIRRTTIPSVERSIGTNTSTAIEKRRDETVGIHQSEP